MRIGPAFLFLLLTRPAVAGCRVDVSADGSSPRLVLSDVSSAFPEIQQKLAKGLTVTIVHEIARPGHDPALFGCRAFYDLWDESYGITVFPGSAVGQSPRAEHSRAKLEQLCDEQRLDFSLAGMTAVEVTTRVDPVSEEQVQKTRQWLASRGISNNSGAIFGRAVGAMVNLKEEKSITRTCPVNKVGKP